MARKKKHETSKTNKQKQSRLSKELCYYRHWHEIFDKQVFQILVVNPVFDARRPFKQAPQTVVYCKVVWNVCIVARKHSEIPIFRCTQNLWASKLVHENTVYFTTP